MSTTETSRPSTDRPTATYPTARRDGGAHPSPSPFAGWRDQAPTELLPVIGAASTDAPTRVSTPAQPTGGRKPHGAARRPSRRRHHLRAALAGVLIAAALLGALQLLALDGIADARRAALATAPRDAAVATATPAAQPGPAQPEQAGAPAQQWVVEGTTTASPSPLDLPRCTTSPDTPMPCLAHVSANSRRAVVLEEDASLTALTRR